ncbi:unnamed protein product [Sympodiomycopsis kandeliae]
MSVHHTSLLIQDQTQVKLALESDEAAEHDLSSTFLEECDEAAYLLSLVQTCTPSAWRQGTRPTTIQFAPPAAPSKPCDHPRIWCKVDPRTRKESKAQTSSSTLPPFQHSPPRGAAVRPLSTILRDSHNAAVQRQQVSSGGPTFISRPPSSPQPMTLASPSNYLQEDIQPSSSGQSNSALSHSTIQSLWDNDDHPPSRTTASSMDSDKEGEVSPFTDSELIEHFVLSDPRRIIILVDSTLQSRTSPLTKLVHLNGGYGTVPADFGSEG